MNGLHDPGLDVDSLLALRPTTCRTDTAAIASIVDRIGNHLLRHDGYVAFSGGKDSMVALDLARRADPDVPVVFFDSGLEFPETLDFIRAVASEWNLDLHRIAADPPLLDVLADTGMWDHTALASRTVDLHRILISDPARRAHGLFGSGEVWGVRADESAGRRVLYASQGRDGVISRVDGTVVYGPVWNWSTADVWSYLRGRQLPVNPLYDKLTRLGVPATHRRASHILDGGHLDRGRLTWIRRGWPALFEQLADVLPRVRQMT
ncbi:phosphoadenosine phosphosulfate reductase family protein [Rhodococcus hoagii]|nr:phosphoadenosine phosphosulfate reductase family protein [Prescottella equi]MBM4574800.1 phosphoadenosine phosphosulfate reductase family protein [Prescottella equi]MBM4653992.1 phosphoadenosine phosphosulfate reductase family protein [Prescottella equi]NKR23542.1 phosphoadenosine phosphosulfate reductase family protein [Prescottella equi]NKT56304.1 phosphoadenosine phosphosulfate reductase family protein [Prescottella equi]